MSITSVIGQVVARGVQVYERPRDAYPGRIDGPTAANGRPSYTIYPRPLTESWILQDAENWT